MKEVEVPYARPDGTGDDHLAVEVCTSCMEIWFDPGERNVVPTGEPDSSGSTGLTGRARELLAIERVRQANEHAEQERTSKGPGEGWQWVPAVLGFPVEISTSKIVSMPWVTWGLALLCVLVHSVVISTIGVSQAADAAGFIPDEWARHGGGTVLTSFFLHGGFVHLLGNMYFFVVFGDNVEDRLGKGRFALLLLFSAVAGAAAHGGFEPQRGTPCVGASAAISGVLAYYALAFPQARLGVFFWVYVTARWLRFSAWFGFVAWLLFQVLGTYKQVAGMSNVSSLAHLGGAAVGVAAAVWSRFYLRGVRRECDGRS